jgi:hypothetical protein
VKPHGMEIAGRPLRLNGADSRWRCAAATASGHPSAWAAINVVGDRITSCSL